MTTQVQQPTVNRNFKSTMFAMIFSDKKELLNLYNAVAEKNYTDPELLTINTLKNAIYMSIQNDLSFIIDSTLSLYEHQSTYNPNLPLRYLHYMSDLYSGIVGNKNIYGTKKLLIPASRFIIFYNGTNIQPERRILKLSDLYVTAETHPSLELEAIMLNINKGYNSKLLETCKTLKDYSEYIYRVRKYAETMAIEDAVEKTITECIKEGILKDFLEHHRMEAKAVSIYEYDQEAHIRMEREDAFEDGRIAGLQEGRNIMLIEQIQKKLNKGKSIEQIADELEESVSVIEDIIKRNNLK